MIAILVKKYTIERRRMWGLFILTVGVRHMLAKYTMKTLSPHSDNFVTFLWRTYLNLLKSLTNLQRTSTRSLPGMEASLRRTMFLSLPILSEKAGHPQPELYFASDLNKNIWIATSDHERTVVCTLFNARNFKLRASFPCYKIHDDVWHIGYYTSCQGFLMRLKIGR